MSNIILRLANFRGINERTISFPSLGVILLDGKTGSGKSTLLEAISFVLYDNSGNTCYPRKDRGKKAKHPTWVQIHFSATGLTVFRQRRPNVIRIEGPGIMLIDDAAQSYLNRIFGSNESWSVGGYLQQDEPYSFFTMSSNDKLALLQQLSLPDQFDQLLNKVAVKLIEMGKQFQETSIQTQVYERMYLTMYSQCPEHIRNQTLWSAETLKSHLDKYQVPNGKSIQEQLQLIMSTSQTQSQQENNLLLSKMGQEQFRIAKIKEGLQLRRQLEASQKSLESDLSRIPSDLNSQISQTEKEIQDLGERITLIQSSERRSLLLAAKSEAEKRLAAIPEEKTRYTLIQLDQYEQILSGPTVDQIKSIIEDVNTAKMYLIKLGQYQKRRGVADKIEALKQRLSNYPEKSFHDLLEMITQQLFTITLQQKKLNCPKCQASLHLNGNHLEELVISELPSSSIADLTQQKIKYQQMEVLFQQRGPLEQELRKLQNEVERYQEVKVPEKPRLGGMSEYQLETLLQSSQVQLKSRLEVPNINVAEERRKFQSAQERARIICDIDQISKEIEKTKSEQAEVNQADINTLLEKRRLLQRQITNFREQTNLRIQLQTRLETILSQLLNCPSEEPDESAFQQLQKDQQQLAQDQNKFIEELNAQIQLNQMVDLYRQHTKCKELETYLNVRAMSLQKIKSTLITAEYIILDQLLSQINSLIEEILEQLFVEPVSVKIRSLRQLKTDDRIKPQVNIEISHKGEECAGVKDVSGGQKLRISLALAIAFARLSNAPFLLLDESLSTLDVNTKENTINVIRRYLGNKLIIAVNHDTTEGIYDSVIRLVE